jgi:hypothetical protein
MSNYPINSCLFIRIMIACKVEAQLSVVSLKDWAKSEVVHAVLAL